MPLKIRNIAAEIDTDMDIFVPLVYEVDKKELRIDSLGSYELANYGGNTEELDERDNAILNEAKEELNRKLNDIKDKIRADVEKVKIEMEELALQKQRAEIERKIDEKKRKLESLNREINRKRSSGLRYEKKMREAKKLRGELDELQMKLEDVPESSLIVEFKEPQTASEVEQN